MPIWSSSPHRRSALSALDRHRPYGADLLAAIFAAGMGRCRDERTGADTITSMRSLNIDCWRMVVPVKDQLAAKTRLHPPPGVARADLAHAFALDTITAVLAGIPPGHLI